jgi:hypothetical protein
MAMFIAVTFVVAVVISLNFWWLVPALGILEFLIETEESDDI